MWRKACGWSVVPQFFNSTVRLIFPSFRGGGGGNAPSITRQRVRYMHVLLSRGVTAVERRARVGHTTSSVRDLQ